MPTPRVIFFHMIGAVVYAVSLYLLIYVLLAYILHFPTNRPLAMYLWPFLYNLMMYGLVAGIFHSLRSSEAKRLQAIAASQTQSLLITAELAALRNKLNPHFLFNTLHSIIALVRKDAVAAESALFRFSDMLRYLLETEKSGSDRVTLEDEISFVRDYLDLEAIRLGARLQVHWDIDAKALGSSIPALSVQPLVENSIKHAFNPRVQAGNLWIRVKRDLNTQILTIQIEDDGPGSATDKIENSTGMGVSTVQRRLQLEYGPRASMKIDTAPAQGFRVTLEIPLN
jgi:LytS/YehU family sensor histidine kinase